MLHKLKQSNHIDMTVGSIARKEIQFIIPLIITTTLQLLYNAVDIIVVGKFAGTIALSAVGSTAQLINLLINVFIGLSVGTSVTTALYFGAKETGNMHKIVHTSVAIAIIGGIFLMVIGCLVCPTLLEWMGTPPDVIEQSILYMQIFFIGTPFNLVYNFCAAILRAVGDAKHPMEFLAIAGIGNVVFNLIFVIVFHMGVEGVALATILAQGISAVLVTCCLMRNEEGLKLEWRRIRVYRAQLFFMMKIGLPAGIQSSFFSISNVLIQSSINCFGVVAMAGNAASGNIEGFISMAMNCVHQSAVTFAGQNLGAKEYKRIKKNLYYCLAIATVVGVSMCIGIRIFGTQIMSLYSNDMEAIQIGLERLYFFCTCYFMCGMMDVMTGHLRGIGYSVVPMIVSMCGICVFRVIWVLCVFPYVNTLHILYVSYPVSWMISFAVLFVYYQLVVKKKILL